MSNLTVQANENGFACIASGINVAATLPVDIIDALREALYSYHILIITEQNISPQELHDFACHFGTPAPHPESSLHIDGLPGVMSLSNMDGRSESLRNGGAFWHTDLSFQQEPASITMLQAIEVPTTGGETLFADQQRAYSTLPDGMKSKLTGLIAEHRYEGRPVDKAETVYHPIVKSHPVTGEKMLYGAADTMVGIKNMQKDEADELIGKLCEHAIQEELIYEHSYEKDELVLWDNAATLHSGKPQPAASRAEENRLMHRVSVKGWPTKQVTS